MTKVKKIIPAVFLLMALGAQAEESVQPFIDEVKAKQDPAAVAKDAESEGYTDRIKATLEPETDESVIQKVKEGRSELKIKKRGKIHGEAGFKLGMGFDRDIKPAAGRFNWNSYEKTFGKGWDPDVQLYFGWQPLHHEYIGSLGIFLSTGFSTNAGTWYPPGVTEEYKIRFTTIPATVGAMYRFNLPYYIRPYVQFGPTMLWYSETRGDSDAKGNKGFTKGTTMNIGASILLDWISSDVEEGLYDDYGIHHQYLTVESSQMKTTGDGIDINANVLYVGFMFEY